MEERKTALSKMAGSVAEGLYQQNRERGLEQVNCLVAELLEMAKELEKKDSPAFNIQELNQILIIAMKALEARDYVLLADILFYDLKELLADGKSDDSCEMKTVNTL